MASGYLNEAKRDGDWREQLENHGHTTSGARGQLESPTRLE